MSPSETLRAATRKDRAGADYLGSVPPTNKPRRVTETTEQRPLALRCAVQYGLGPRPYRLLPACSSGLVGGFTGRGKPDLKALGFRVSNGGPAPAPFRCIHGVIMPVQKKLDKPFDGLYSVRTVNMNTDKDEAMKTYTYEAMDLGGAWKIAEIGSNGRVLGFLNGYFDTKEEAIEEMERRGLK